MTRIHYNRPRDWSWHQRRDVGAWGMLAAVVVIATLALGWLAWELPEVAWRGRLGL